MKNLKSFKKTVVGVGGGGRGSQYHNIIIQKISPLTEDTKSKTTINPSQSLEIEPAHLKRTNALVHHHQLLVRH